MAGQLINLTRSIVTLVSPASTTYQLASESLDVSACPGLRFDFCLKTFALVGTKISVTLETSMYNNDDSAGGWSPLGTFEDVDGPNKSRFLSTASVTPANPVLRYIRYVVTPTSVSLVSFEILGVAW